MNQLPSPLSARARALAVAASLLLTGGMLAANLGLAERYAGSTGTTAGDPSVAGPLQTGANASTMALGPDRTGQPVRLAAALPCKGIAVQAREGGSIVAQ